MWLGKIPEVKRFLCPASVPNLGVFGFMESVTLSDLLTPLGEGCFASK